MKKRLLSLLILLACIQAFGQSKSEKYQELTKELASGWNTWNYYSMMSYVLLPEGLSLNLNLRPAVLGNPYDPNYFYDNIFVTKSQMVKPKAHSIDGCYTSMTIDGWKGNTLNVQSASVDDQIYLLLNPIKRSATAYFVELESGILWNNPGSLTLDDDRISASFQSRNIEIRSTKNSTDAARPYAAPYQSYLADTVFAIYTGPEKTLNEIIDIVEKAKQNYHDDAQKFEDHADVHEAIQTVLGWNTLYDADLDRVITPVSRGWNEAWQGFVLFEWDTYFAALLSGLNNKELAYSNVFAITKMLNESGAVAFTQQPRGQLAVNSQPPVGSMVCWLLYEKYKEEWFLEEIFDELLSWNRWWVENRSYNGYLTWGASWKGAREQDARWESGLDNSPMYDDVKISDYGKNSLLDLADVGLNSLYVADCQYLIKMAKILGRKLELKELQDREKTFTKQVESLWSEEHGIYLNKNITTGAFSNRLSPTLFYPMIAGIPGKSQAERIFNEHFYNEEEFYGDYILPSCARNDPEYDNLYWRGAIWGPMNFLAYIGIRNYSDKATEDLVGKSYDLFTNCWNKHGYILENIHAEKGNDHLEDQVNSDLFYHWGALMGLMKVMEDGKY